MMRFAFASPPPVATPLALKLEFAAPDRQSGRQKAPRRGLCDSFNVYFRKEHGRCARGVDCNAWFALHCFIGLLLLAGQSEGFQATGMHKSLLERCGLPTDSWSTRHCFSDVSHFTCCLLGPEARAGAKHSSHKGTTTNEHVGVAAEHAWVHQYARQPRERELIPWCTSFYAMECAAMATQFKDGTKIDFVAHTDSLGQIVERVPSTIPCEMKAREWVRNIQSVGNGVEFMKGWDAHVAGYPATSEHTHISMYDVTASHTQRKAQGRYGKMSPPPPLAPQAALREQCNHYDPATHVFNLVHPEATAAPTAAPTAGRLYSSIPEEWRKEAKVKADWKKYHGHHVDERLVAPAPPRPPLPPPDRPSWYRSPPPPFPVAPPPRSFHDPRRSKYQWPPSPPPPWSPPPPPPAPLDSPPLPPKAPLRLKTGYLTKMSAYRGARTVDIEPEQPGQPVAPARVALGGIRKRGEEVEPPVLDAVLTDTLAVTDTTVARPASSRAPPAANTSKGSDAHSLEGDERKDPSGDLALHMAENQEKEDALTIQETSELGEDPQRPVGASTTDVEEPREGRQATTPSIDSDPAAMDTLSQAEQGVSSQVPYVFGGSTAQHKESPSLSDSAMAPPVSQDRPKVAQHSMKKTSIENDAEKARFDPPPTDRLLDERISENVDSSLELSPSPTDTSKSSFASEFIKETIKDLLIEDGVHSLPHVANMTEEIDDIIRDSVNLNQLR